MLKKHIDYTDFDGDKKSGDFYFNLTRTELIEMNLRYPKGLQAHMETLTGSDDQLAIYNAMKEVVMMAYGEKSEDGKYFRKSRELAEAFTHTAAFDELIVEFFKDSKAAADFVNAIVPQESK